MRGADRGTSIRQHSPHCSLPPLPGRLPPTRPHLTPPHLPCHPRLPAGAKNFNALNETLQRALLICVAACVPIGLLWNNSEGLLMHLGQPQSIAHGAAR